MIPSILDIVGDWAKQHQFWTSSGLRDEYINIAKTVKHEYISLYANFRVCYTDPRNKGNLAYDMLKPGDPEFFTTLHKLVIAEPLTSEWEKIRGI